MFPALDAAGEERILAGNDAPRQLVSHAVYPVVRGLVLRGKKILPQDLSCIINEMNLLVVDWMNSGRVARCHEFMLNSISDRYLKVIHDSLLVNNPAFISLDAKVRGQEGRGHGDAKTYGDIISEKMAGKAGSSLAFDRIGAVSDDLVYDPDLDAYVRVDKMKDRKKHVVVERRTADAGIFSYSDEENQKNEQRLERLSPIRVAKITDRIVMPTKAVRRRWKKHWRGTPMYAPGPGESASVMPTPKANPANPSEPPQDPFDFKVNKNVNHRLPEKCLACRFLRACSSWLCGGYFTRGIHGPAACAGPFTGEEFAPK